MQFASVLVSSFRLSIYYATACSNISSVMTNDESFKPAVRQLCSIAELDADQCLANSNC